MRRQRRRCRARDRAARGFARVVAAALVIVSALLAASIAFVPLDDRPVTLQLPVMLGAIAGERVDAPPPAMLGRYLQAGRPDDIIAWLNELRSCDELRGFDRHACVRRTHRFARSRNIVCGCGVALARVRASAPAPPECLDRRVRDDRASRADRRSGRQRIFRRLSGMDVSSAICKPARSAVAAGASAGRTFTRSDRRTAAGRIPRRCARATSPWMHRSSR